MGSKLSQALEEFIETAGQIGAGIGLSRVASQLYALLFISNKSISLDDMVERLGVSKGNISINIRALEKWGAVRKVWIKGDNRKDYYIAEFDTFKIIAQQLKIGLSRRIDDAMEAISRAERSIREEERRLNGHDKDKAKGYLERLKKAKEMHNQLKGLIETASKIIR